MLKEKRRNRLLAALLGLLLGLDVFFLGAAVWEKRNWDDLSMYEVVSQLATPARGTADNIIDALVYGCVLPGILTAAAVPAAAYLLRRKPWLGRALQAGTMLSLALLLGLGAYAWELLDMEDYLRDSGTESYFIERNYADPKTVAIRFPEKKRNLIYIWLESMEATFADEASGGAFPENRIPELTALAAEGDSFSGAAGGVNGACSPTGMSWTMGALFAQTSGLPLKIPLSESSMDSQERFFPGVTALGDILAEAGYRQAFLLGSDAAFAGRDRYFTQHGGVTLWDYKYSLETGEIPPDYHVWWGYEDEKLFDFAKKHLRELAAGEEPFSLSLLTVDTHFPDGYACRLCREEFADPYSNVMACSSRQVTAFVDWLRRQDFWENTTVVISGDHITMNAGYCDGVDPAYQRRAYSVILNAAAEEAAPERARLFTAMDLFPTALAALGAEIPGDRLGLGVNLYSGRDTLLEREGYAGLDRELRRHSALMDALSGLDEGTLALGKALRELDTGLAARWEPAGLRLTLRVPEDTPGLTGVLVFADADHGGQRQTLSMQNAEPVPGGGWTALLPREELTEEDFTLNLYAVTAGGRFPLDAPYAWTGAENRAEREAG